MSDISKKYLAALREAAIGLPLGPFRGDFPDEFRRAVSEFAYVVSQLVFWAVAMLAYPIAIFVLAAVVVHSDAVMKKAYRKDDEEWFKGMDREMGDE
jgi:hypothetical protein